MIKLIASDIDGTLLPEGTDQINPEIFQVIRTLKERGVMFAAASGRHYSSMVRLFEEVKDDIIFISENGALVCCKGYTILEDLLDWEMVKEWVADVRQIPGASFILGTKEGYYTESLDPEFIRLEREGYKTNLEIQDDVLAEEKRIIEVSIYRAFDIEEVFEIMNPKWSQYLHCTVSGDIWVDFMNKETNKGRAIHSIQETMNISPDETMVFGDNHNDVEMMLSATESYAVGNAVDAVKEAANHIADTNVNDGVLKVIKTLL